MQNKQQHPEADPRLDTPSESNRDKHINFREVEEESAGNFMIDKGTSDRQKQWQKEIKEGEEEKERSNQAEDNAAIPMDEDDTLGVP